ncbi:MAG: hypothetical protein HGA45_33380, partial [Chloroflexales bacterium]|nr:hypothetical protein [Chloroflexales bacterium]
LGGHASGCGCARCRRARPLYDLGLGGEPVEAGSEHTRWAQGALNRALGLRLPIDGVMTPAVRSAVRSFQRREGLPEDGIVGPPTEAALARAVGGAPPEGGEELFLGSLWDTVSSGVSSTVGAITGSGRIIDRTANSPKDYRKGKPRDMSKVKALVLHQMAFSRGSDPTKYDKVNSHFAILPDGKILQLHPVAALLWASNGFNSGSVAVEFAGNFPNTRGKCWSAQKFGCHKVTKEQIEAGRLLIRHLIRTMGLTTVLAHRQSSASRENDPGPDIWYHVGQWAINNLGLKDGGPGFKVGSGNPIPDLWRTWGAARPSPELEQAPEPEALDPESPEHTRWLQRALNGALGLRLPEDGRMSPAVRSAVRSFQRRQGLPGDGELSDELEGELMALGAPAHHHGQGEGEAFIDSLWGAPSRASSSGPPLGAGPAAPPPPAGLSRLRALSGPTTAPTVANALEIVQIISQHHAIPWRLGYTILEHEGGVRLIKHPDGVMQTTSGVRQSHIPRIPRPLKLALLGLAESDPTADATLSSRLASEFRRRLAVQIATGVQELADNLRRFSGYVALAFQAYNAGSGWAAYTVTGGKAKQRPRGVDDVYWESLCRFAASLLHQPPAQLRIDIGTWQCDANIPTWFSHIPVYDRQSGLQLIAFKYLRSITERIRSQRPTTPCTWAVHGASHRQPGSGAISSRTTRPGALDKLYQPSKLGQAYYQAVQASLTAIPDDGLPLKVLNGRLAKMPHASGGSPVAVIP